MGASDTTPPQDTGLWRRAVPNLARALTRLIFPPRCLVCGDPVEAEGALCPTCWGAIHFLDGPLCAVCGQPFAIDPGPDAVCAGCLAHPPDYDAARALMRYDDASKPPILALKHADRLDLAPPLARAMFRVGAALAAEADIVASVPLHRRRLWKRRYNQAAELARPLARIAGLPNDPLLLQRRRATKSQGDMPSASARRRNVRGAFFVPAGKKSALKDRTVLLIDDVITTGATVNACAKTLKRAGARKVYVLALARVVRDSLE